MRRRLLFPLAALVAAFVLSGEVLGQACVSPDGVQCIWLAPMIGASTCPAGWTPVSSCPTPPGYCYDANTGACWPVPGVLGPTCDPPHVWSDVPCPPPPTPTPGPTPPPAPVAVSWDPGLHAWCFRSDPDVLPLYLAQCYDADFWRIELENVPPGVASVGIGSTDAGTWAVSLYVGNDNLPVPADPALRWCGVALTTLVSAETSQGLWLRGSFTWAPTCCTAGDAYALAMIFAGDPTTGWAYELDVWFAGKMSGRDDPRPEYVVGPRPFGALDAWTVLDGSKLGIALNRDGYGPVAIPVTALLEKVSAENPATFPAPPGGWRSVGHVDHMGVLVETFEAAWGALGVLDLTMWAGGVPHPIRRHLQGGE
jgi:hypothetical protein